MFRKTSCPGGFTVSPNHLTPQLCKGFKIPKSADVVAKCEDSYLGRSGVWGAQG